jgi:hypothetical protein
MEEMAKAKHRAEEERDVYRHMLEQVYERSMKERQELRRDAQSKLEASAGRVRTKKQRVLQLEKELREKGQVEEEKNAYREQCQALMEQCQSLMEQLSAAHGGGDELHPPEARGARGSSTPVTSPSPHSLLDRVRSGVRSSIAAAQNAHGGTERHMSREAGNQ